MTIPEDDLPKWAACLKKIEERIDDGTYPQGKWLLQVYEIASTLNAAISSVRLALSELNRRQVVTNVHRVGWYVGQVNTR